MQGLSRKLDCAELRTGNRAVRVPHIEARYTRAQAQLKIPVLTGAASPQMPFAEAEPTWPVHVISEALVRKRKAAQRRSGRDLHSGKRQYENRPNTEVHSRYTPANSPAAAFARRS